jgi:Tol biopolymer transport system component
MIALAGVSRDRPTQIYIRPLDADAFRPVPGTEGGSYPVWSPDGREIGFRQAGRFRRVAIGGGSPQVIMFTGNVRSAPAWSPDGTLLFHALYRGPLLRVGITGGEPSVVLPQQALNWFSPAWLPDGRRFLVARFAYDDAMAQEAGLYVGSIDSTAVTPLVKGRIVEVALGEGELYFRRGTELLAQSFDPRAARLLGEPRVLSASATMMAAGGRTLVYAEPAGGLSEQHQITVFSRTGQVLSTIGPAGTYRDPRLSPDGHMLAIARADDNGLFSLWTFDLVRNIDTRISRASVVAPAWSHDGRALYAGGETAIRRYDPVSAVPPEIVRETKQYTNAGDSTPDGKEFMYYEVTDVGRAELRAARVDGNGETRLIRPALSLGQTPETALSPDGKWLAGLVPDGGNRLFATQYPAGRRIPVAGIDGIHPRWRRDGRELYFSQPGNQGHRIMAVDVTWNDGSPAFGPPRELFTIRNAVFVNRGFDVTPDGQRFVAIVRGEPDRTPLRLRVRTTSRQ